MAVAPSSSIPTLLPEMTCEPAAFPWIVTPLAPSTSTPWNSLPRSASPVMSVPIRLPMTVTPVTVVPEIRTPTSLAEITLPGPTWVSDV